MTEAYTPRPGDIERYAQVMRDANTADAWTSPQLVPFRHFADVMLRALFADKRLIPADAPVIWRCACGTLNDDPPTPGERRFCAGCRFDEPFVDAAGPWLSVRTATEES